MFQDILKGILDWGLEKAEKAIADKRRAIGRSLGRMPEGSSALKRQEADALARARAMGKKPIPEEPDEDDDFSPGGTD